MQNKKNMFIVVCGAILAIIISLSIGDLFTNHIVTALTFSMLFMNTLFIAYYMKNNKVYAVNDVVVIFIVIFMLYALGYPIDSELGTLNGISPDKVKLALTCYFIANVCLLVGLAVGHTFSKTIAESRMKVFTPRMDLRPVSTFVLIAGIGMMFYSIYRSGGFEVLGIANRLKSFSADLELRNAITIPWKTTINAALIGLALSVKNTKQYKSLMFILISLSSFYLFGMGSRTLIFLSCLPVIGILIDKGYIKITKKKTAIAFIIVLVMFSPLFTNLRNQVIYGTDINNLPPEAWAFSKGETGSAFEVTTVITSSSTENMNADATYFTGFSYFLPSFIYNNLFGHPKPMNLNEWYTYNYFPYYYDNGVGLGFSPVAQAWMNGGYLGIIVVFLIVGALISVVNNRSSARYIFLALAIWFQRSSFHSVWNEFIYTFAVLVAIYFISTILSRQPSLEAYHRKIAQ